MRTSLHKLKSFEEAKKIARLHLNNINQSFLASLGERFLSEFYYTLSRSPYGFCLFLQREERIVGFVAGAYSIKKFHRDFLIKKGVKCSLLLFTKLLSKNFLRGLMEKLHYPEKVRGGGDLPQAELIAIAVDKDFQGKGLGSELMKFFLEELKKRGIEEVKVMVGESNLKGRNFYKLHGFEEKEEVIFRGGVRSQVMVRKVK